MGLLKTGFRMFMTFSIFYSGIQYERWNNQEKLQEARQQVHQMQSVDYKVLSLMQDAAERPWEIKRVFQDYDSLMHHPDALQKRIEQYAW